VVRGELIEDAAKLELVRSQWDELAVASGNPYALSGWLLPWWRHAAPSAAELRAVVALDGDELVGIAPFFAARGPGGAAAYRLLGARTSIGVEPLARPGREEESAAVFAEQLAAARPSPELLVLEGIDADSRWPALLHEAWVGSGLRVRRRQKTPAPLVELHGRTYEEWLRERSGKFRKAIRRGDRRLEERGATLRLATAAELQYGLQDFIRLHHARWADRGGSGVVTEQVEQMLAELPAGLDAGQLRLWLIESGGQTVSAEVFLAAGGVTTSWLGGFDDSFADEQPSFLSIHAEIRHAFEREDERVDLGPGAQPFKYRFADGERSLVWVDLVPSSRRRPLIIGALAAGQARRRISPLVPRTPKRALKWLLRRGGSQ
jgi:CelD/BcsL family acetyltransferase involved in cellulose biosynthesis